MSKNYKIPFGIDKVFSKLSENEQFELSLSIAMYKVMGFTADISLWKQIFGKHKKDYPEMWQELLLIEHEIVITKRLEGLSI